MLFRMARLPFVATFVLIGLVGGVAPGYAHTANQDIRITIESVTVLEVSGTPTFTFGADDFEVGSPMSRQKINDETFIRYMTNLGSDEPQAIIASLVETTPGVHIMVAAQQPEGQGGGHCGVPMGSQWLHTDDITVIANVERATCVAGITYSVQVGVDAGVGTYTPQVRWTMTSQ